MSDDRDSINVERWEPSGETEIATTIRCEFPADADHEQVVRELFHAYAEAMLKIQERAFAAWLALPVERDELTGRAVPLTEPGSSS